VNLTDKVVPEEGVVVTPLQGELVLLHLETSNYYGLDAVGARAWEVLVTQGGSIADACAAIALEFDAEPPRIEADLLALVAALQGAKLVRVVP
jgi:hypothetical protein